MRQRQVLVITDVCAGSDDEAALILLSRARAVKLTGIVVTSGNVWAAEAQRRARYLMRLTDQPTVPILLGVTRQYEVRRRAVYWRHQRRWTSAGHVGALASGKRKIRAASESTVRPANLPSGVRFITQQARRSGGRLEMLVLGPAAPLACALRADPQIAPLVRRVHLMGGALAVAGNATKRAEFNYWFDPIAIAAVLASGIPTTLVTLDACKDIYVGTESLRRLVRELTPRSRRVLQSTMKGRMANGLWSRLWDEIALAVFLKPQIAHARIGRARVDTTLGRDSGKLSVKWCGRHSAGHRIVMRLKSPASLAMALSRLSGE